jgi:hypothetical protein
MTKRTPLDRLRDISKNRSIRSLQPARPDGGREEEHNETYMAAIEWPVPSSRC